MLWNVAKLLDPLHGIRRLERISRLSIAILFAGEVAGKSFCSFLQEQH
jgi:hypothetical protein